MSLCRYCFEPILWISKPNGGWYPPFNATEEITTLDYELRWDLASNDWSAEPIDKDLSIKLTPHECKARQERLTALPVEPSDITPPPKVEIRDKIMWRNPKPEQYMRIYQRLSSHCRTCGALPGEWCTYKDSPDEYTTDLHTTRKVL